MTDSPAPDGPAPGLASLSKVSGLRQFVNERLKAEPSHLMMTRLNQYTTPLIYLEEAHAALLAADPGLADTPDALLARVVVEARARARTQLGWMYSGQDPVIVYTIATLEGAESVRREWADRARASYQRDQAEYDRLIGERLPPDLAAEGRWRAAVAGYDNDTHPTAAADWVVYRSRRQGQQAKPPTGLATGLALLDECLTGLHGLTVLGGPAGCGKSSLALFAAASALRAHPDLAVLYLLLDPGMTKFRLYERLVCLTARVDYRSYRLPPTPEIARAVAQAEGELGAGLLPRLAVADLAANPPAGGLDADAIAARRDRLLGASGATRALVVVDYLGRIDVPRKVSPTSLDADQYRLEVVEGARGRSWSPRHQAADPYLVIGEVAKGRAGAEPLTADHLLGSARLGYAADTVLMLQADARAAGQVPDRVAVTLRVAKGRDGTVRAEIPLLFDHTRYLFLDPTSEPPPAGDGRRPGATPTGRDPLAGIARGTR